MFKRVTLFLITHVLVITTILSMLTLLGLYPYLAAHHVTYLIIAGFCVVWGTLGSCLSLLTARMTGEMLTHVVQIDPRHPSVDERILLDRIYPLANKAGLKTMPDVGIYQSPELNAFITGPTKKKSLIAISSGLLNNMGQAEMEAMLGHAVTVIANGDGITLRLIEGITHSFSLFLTRNAFFIISLGLVRKGQRQDKNISTLVYSLLALIFDILFTLLGSLVVTAFSRWRIYRADEGGAQLAGRDNMIAALQRLRSATELEDERAPAMDAFKIAHRPNWIELLCSHPSLIKRINRLAYHAHSTH